ncbi:hypothetical protein GQX74_001501 [Glossina fuscipes]|nr:hypothetical protein GQX74_001501 [Glossina fuscipes]
MNIFEELLLVRVNISETILITIASKGYHFINKCILDSLLIIIPSLTECTMETIDLHVNTRKDGVRLGGNVSGFREGPVPHMAAAPSHTRTVLIRSMFSVEAGRKERCFGYHPLCGAPESRSISFEAKA